jgi:DNA (cytosine-5)-methyltransferase 1
MKHISLFSGIGGIDLAAHWAGFTTVHLVENNSFCTQVLEKNFPTVPIHKDIRDFDGNQYAGEIELISAGFPCQPHSIAGKRKASSDERNLWGEVVRVISEVRPRWFLGENVQGLLTSEQGEFFPKVLNDLESLGYSVGWCVYGAKDVGAVHRRARIFIIAYSKSYADGGYLLPELWSQLETRVTEAVQPRKKRNTANTYSTRREEQWRPCTNEKEDFTFERNIYQEIAGGDWRDWGISPLCTESRVRRKHDGIPYRLDRLRALGNTVVPQQVFPILSEIAKISNLGHNQVSRCIK